MMECKKSMASIKLKYEVICVVGTVLQIELWEEDNKIHYSRRIPSGFRKVNEQIENAISDVPVKTIRQMISHIGADQRISQDEMVMDPSFYNLEIIDSDGGQIIYHWSDDYSISSDLKDFIDYIEHFE